MSTTARTTGTTADRDRSGRRTHDDGVLLADALSVNLLVSAASGVVLLAAPPWWGATIGVATPVVAVLGAGLVLFAAAIGATLARPPSLLRGAALVVVADVVWVLTAVTVLAADPLTAVGETLLAAVTVVVGALAIAQSVGLRRGAGADRPGARPFVLRARRTVAATPSAAWRAVADAAGYASFAPGIATTETDGDVADGMVRTCVDDAGRSWHERCTVLEPERRYRMEVDVSTYPWSLRLLIDRLGMTWSVRPTPDGGSELELTFAGAVLLGVFGRLAIGRLTAGAPHVTIVDRYAASLVTATHPG